MAYLNRLWFIHSVRKIKCYFGYAPCISLPIGTSGKPLGAFGKFSSAIGKSMTGKTLATSGEEITNAMIGNDLLAIYW